MENQKPLERLRCVVERITFQSDGYSVLKCSVCWKQSKITSLKPSSAWTLTDCQEAGHVTVELSGRHSRTQGC